MIIPRDSATTGKAFSSAPGATPRASATWATVVAPGVWTDSGAPRGSGSVTVCGSAEATSTFAA